MYKKDTGKPTRQAQRKSAGEKKAAFGGKSGTSAGKRTAAEKGKTEPFDKASANGKSPFRKESTSFRNANKPYGTEGASAEGGRASAGKSTFVRGRKPKFITDSATGERIDADKRPTRAKKPDAERKAANGSELAKAIQWFPGHMTKAIREIGSSLALVDIAIELCDARIPIASRNPNIEKILGTKPYITLMNKTSLADPNKIAHWKEYFASQGKTVIFTDCHTGTGICEIVPAVREALKDKLAAYERRGMRRLPRAMILGVTNSGKSTLINKLYGARKTKAEDRAGVTREQQWVTVEGSIELLDTPGILWPKFHDENVGLHLAFTGAIKDEILDIEEIAVILCRVLTEKYPLLLAARYKLTQEDMDGAPHEVFEAIARNRGLLLRGAEADTLRCARMLLDEFRDGKIGRITLETPQASKKTENE